MPYCTIHARCFVPQLNRWLAADPVHIQGIATVIPVIEGICDTCVQEAKASLFTQFPILYVHESLMPSVP
jgi:hypothetical protein